MIEETKSLSVNTMHAYAWFYRKFVKSSNQDFYFEIRRFRGNFIYVKSIDKEISVVRKLLLTHKYVLHHWKSISRIFFYMLRFKKRTKVWFFHIHSVEKREILSYRKIFRQINSLALETYLVKPLLSRNFWPKMRDREFP